MNLSYSGCSSSTSITPQPAQAGCSTASTGKEQAPALEHRAVPCSQQKARGAVPCTASISPQLPVPAAICPHIVLGPWSVQSRTLFVDAITASFPAAPQWPPRVKSWGLPLSFPHAELSLGLGSNFRIMVKLLQYFFNTLKMYLQEPLWNFPFNLFQTVDLSQNIILQHWNLNKWCGKWGCDGSWLSRARGRGTRAA